MKSKLEKVVDVVLFLLYILGIIMTTNAFYQITSLILNTENLLIVILKALIGISIIILSISIKPMSKKILNVFFS